jgi:hypothetical protein
MTQKRYIPKQIIRKLREAEVYFAEGMTAVEVALKIDVSEQMYYWRWKEFSGMQLKQAKQIKTLE